MDPIPTFCLFALVPSGIPPAEGEEPTLALSIAGYSNNMAELEEWEPDLLAAIAPVPEAVCIVLAEDGIITGYTEDADLVLSILGERCQPAQEGEPARPAVLTVLGLSESIDLITQYVPRWARTEAAEGVPNAG